MTTTALMSPLGTTIYKHKYSMDGQEEWHDTARRVVEAVMGPRLPHLMEETIEAIADLKFLPGGRYLYASGRPFAQTQNCLLTKVEDNREDIADYIRRVITGLMTGAGIGGVYTAIRGRGTPTKGMGGMATGPISVMKMVNENGRQIVQGGGRRAALWAGLHWHHPDVFEFIHVKDWTDEVKVLKEKDPNFPADLDMTNISVILDDEFFAAMEDPEFTLTYPNGDSGETYTVDHTWALKVYWEVIEQMLTTGEPGFSVDTGENQGENLRNACTEVTSRDDNDICNLGSINMARVNSIEEFDRLVELGTAFLLCGTLYSEVPYSEVADTRTKNRRLGLGLMGVYEWLALRGKPYAPDVELGTWLERYQKSTTYAAQYAMRLGVSIPLKTRAMAPNGTIAIIAGTTSSIEPMFAPATKRKYRTGADGQTVSYQYTIDAIAERLVSRGLDVDHLESAYDLARDPERRVLFQAWFQQYVDHGISSTINLPAADEHAFTHQEFGEMLLPYLPSLRGITVYPDGARGGQPLTAVSYEEAAAALGVEYAEVSNEQACVSGVCGL